MSTSREELANSVTSIIAVILCLLGGYVLYENLAASSTSHKVGALIYFLCITCTYMSSAVYHGLSGTKFTRRLRIVDHCSIYFAIAGSYTPYLILYFEDNYGVLYLSTIWSIAILGALYKIRYTGVHEDFSLASYLLFGWIGLLIIYEVANFMSSTSMACIVASGALYTLGTYFYKNDDKKYYHAVWHIMCLLGTAAHFMSLMECFNIDIL